MKYKLSAVAAFVSLTAIISCAGNDDKDYIDKSLISPSAENKTAQPAVTNTAANETTNTIPNATTVAPATNTINLNPQTNAVNLNTQNVTSNTQQPQQLTARGMNPPHGQPNHRCDIAVGAPLNSPPGPTATPAQTIAIPAKKDSAKN